jgi:hypothetical protein
MANGLLMERLHFAKGIDPVANAFASTVYSDIYNMKDLERALFVIYDGVGATGSSTFTVEACDNVSASNHTAIAFMYREILTDDTEGTLTAGATTGFVNTVGSSKIVLIEVREDALAASGYGYVRLKSVESSAVATLGGVMFIGESKVPSASKATILT